MAAPGFGADGTVEAAAGAPIRSTPNFGIDAAVDAFKVAVETNLVGVLKRSVPDGDVGTVQ